jgi:hypothetical protein
MVNRNRNLGHTDETQMEWQDEAHVAECETPGYSAVQQHSYRLDVAFCNVIINRRKGRHSNHCSADSVSVQSEHLPECLLL